MGGNVVLWMTLHLWPVAGIYTIDGKFCEVDGFRAIRSCPVVVVLWAVTRTVKMMDSSGEGNKSWKFNYILRMVSGG